MSAVAEAPPITEQLSLEIIGFARPDQSSFKVGGSITTRRHELHGDDTVLVQILNDDGEIIASSHGKVSGLSFKKHRPANQRPWVERIHQVELTDGRPEQIH